MGRKYIVTFESIAVTTAVDLFEIEGPAVLSWILHVIKITQENITGSEQLLYSIVRATGVFTSGSGGGTATVGKMQDTAAAHGLIAVERTNTTRALAGSGALTTLLLDAQNILNGWHYLPTPEARIEFGGNEAVIIGLESTPGASTTMSGYAVIEIIG